MVNIFVEVKRVLKPVEVVRFYLGQGKQKAGSYWYVSPFRGEKTASFCVSDKKGIHDFGDNQHYDIFSFTAKLFDIDNPKKAAEKLARDFNLESLVEDDRPKIVQQREMSIFLEKRKKEEAHKKAIQDYYDFVYDTMCDRFKFYKSTLEYMQEHRENLEETDLAMLYAKKDLFEQLCDDLLETEAEEVWKNNDIWEGYLV